MLLTLIIIIILASAISDLIYMRIPNVITIPGMVVAMSWYGLSLGVVGLIFSGLGLVIGVAVFLPFYLMGGMGAGDVKLMGAVGALLGPTDLFYCILFVAVVGGIYALIQMVRFLWGKNAHREKPVLRYGLAIGLGTSLFLYTR